eukprot:COSAG06_NODE_3695_length_4999_cov_8.221837_8_plen_42_part_00
MVAPVASAVTCRTFAEAREEGVLYCGSAWRGNFAEEAEKKR